MNYYIKKKKLTFITLKSIQILKEILTEKILDGFILKNFHGEIGTLK